MNTNMNKKLLAISVILTGVVVWGALKLGGGLQPVGLSVLRVRQGGTGTTTMASGEVLFGNGEDAIGTSNFTVDANGNATTTLSHTFSQYTSCNLDTDANGLLVCGTDADTYDASWEEIWNGAITPTSTSAGIFVRASSTIDSSFRVNGNATTTGSCSMTELLANAGTLTIGGSNATNNENVTFDFETTANALTLGSGSGVDIWKFGALSSVLNDGKRLSFGTGFDSSFAWATEGNDNLQLGLNVGNADYSGYMCLLERADLNNANRSPLATSANPVLRIYSSDVNSATDYLEMYHDQDDANLNVGAGDFNIDLPANATTTVKDNFQVEGHASTTDIFIGSHLHIYHDGNTTTLDFGNF